MKWKGDNVEFEVYGTSHAPEIGVTAKGLPFVSLDEAALSAFMDRRRAKKEAYSTARAEADVPEITFKEGEFRAVIRNKDVRSGDYNDLYGIPRPSHADYAAHLMDGRLDFSGGGEFSGRLTAPLCVLGFAAKSFLRQKGVNVSAWVSSIGGVSGASYKNGLTDEMLSCGEKGEWTPAKKEEMMEEIVRAASDKDSVGGRIECAVTGLKGGVGGGDLGSMEGKIASLLYLIPAVKGVEFGAGFDLAKMRGSEANDPLRVEDGKVVFLKNDAGGINGGLTNGNAITVAAAVRPTPSIGKKQLSVDLVKKQNAEIEIKGRHDACIVPRAVPVVEAAVAIAVADALLKEEK
ncbi:MAG TPA: chorismate synthase [Clostridiales bacterium]|nr:chorismate synthase [Clostridiales bacterium]